jgi:hypothetical protein
MLADPALPLPALTEDEIGKSALRQGLKKIIVRNTDKYHSARGLPSMRAC